MGEKKQIIFLLFIIVFLSCLGKISMAADEKSNDSLEILVAIHNGDNIVMTGTHDKFFPQVDGYNWIVGNKSYVLSSTYTGVKELCCMSLLIEYDVLVMAGGQDIQLYLAGDNILGTFSSNIKDNLENFISNGGGYIGHCGGAFFPLNMDHGTYTVYDYIENKNSFLTDTGIETRGWNGFQFISEYVYFDFNGIPRLCVRPINEEPDPTRIGLYAYIPYSGWDINNDSHHIGGTCDNLVIRNKDHPILRDFIEDTWRVRWVSGPAFNLTNSVVEVDCLADFPEDSFENNQSTRIEAWSWKYPIIDLKNILRTFWWKFKYENVTEAIKSFFPVKNLPKNFTWFNTSQTIVTDLPKNPALIAFLYNNSGRVVLSGSHPENPIWDGGHIDNLNETSPRTLWQGLHQWVHEDNNPIQTNELTDEPYKWFIRREVAWASGLVDDNHLPPIYGKSQVVDISPELQQNTEVNLTCTVGKEKNDSWTTLKLSLYYRYHDNGNWTSWIPYGFVEDTPYEFTFNSTNANGTGEYEFCSILNTTTSTGPPEQIIYYQDFCRFTLKEHLFALSISQPTD